MKTILFLWIAFLLIFLFFAGEGRMDFPTSKRNYFSLQAYSWLKGHLDLVLLPGDSFELSINDGKAYIFWPPLSAVFALPFVILFGPNVSDVLYTTIWASFVPVLMYLVLVKARTAKIIPKITDRYILLLTIFFTFGTVFFWVALVGSVWFTSQSLSLIPLLISLYFLFSFRKTRKESHYLLSILCLCLAFWGRYVLVASVALHLYILFEARKYKILRLATLTICILIINFGLYSYSNFIRFGQPLENGLNKLIYHPKWYGDFVKYGVFNFHYLAKNTFYFLLSPLAVENSFPFIKPNPEGNSIFITSPLFLLLIKLVSIFRKNRNRNILLILVFTTVIMSFTFLLYLSTGWIQFGYRYALDAIPFLILLLAWVIELFPKFFVNFLFGLSIIINLLGFIWIQQVTRGLNF